MAADATADPTRWPDARLRSAVPPPDPLTSLPPPDEVAVPLRDPQATPTVTALVWDVGEPGAAAVILAHGAGTDMRHRHMQRHATDLVAAGHPTAVFNFPFTEVGRRRPDPAARLLSAWRDVIATVGPRLRAGPGDRRPLVIGGRSMGGRMASMLAVEEGAALGVAGVVCLAYPLHPPGRADKLRVAHWPDLEVPILLVCGTRDAMAPPDALQANVVEHMPPGLATVHAVEGADHSFRVRRKDGRTEDEALAEVASVTAGWLARLPS